MGIAKILRVAAADNLNGERVSKSPGRVKMGVKNLAKHLCAVLFVPNITQENGGMTVEMLAIFVLPGRSSGNREEEKIKVKGDPSWRAREICEKALRQSLCAEKKEAKLMRVYMLYKNPTTPNNPSLAPSLPPCLLSLMSKRRPHNEPFAATQARTHPSKSPSHPYAMGGPIRPVRKGTEAHQMNDLPKYKKLYFTAAHLTAAHLTREVAWESGPLGSPGFPGAQPRSPTPWSGCVGWDTTTTAGRRVSQKL
ncbi:uncharacterized protein LY89DRAFT_674424 [Mollisia scopiformis]|uniref:Uncharacterized protein n=1 Tax=Mollisia scopiformis TaxID=149040 RepID=A0A194WTR1_MOLSC|nr:uncharacterized protein LY89DRAFT_674424 [Mollisia scopiformis]KUJ11074.1 hypothetical protein LY89DRAFT_674424 [Mollisia scopiformis]